MLRRIYRRIWMGLWVGAVLATVAACSDDDGEGSGSNGGTGEASDGGGSGSNGGTGGASDCVRLCSITVPCPNDVPGEDTECTAECNMLLAEACPEELGAFVDCILASPATTLECNAFGETDIAVGACPAEDAALAACLGG